MGGWLALSLTRDAESPTTCTPTQSPPHSSPLLNHIPRNHDPLNLTRPLVNPRHPRVPIQLLDHEFRRVPHPAVDLHRAVDDPPQRFTTKQLHHRRLSPERLPLIALVRRPIHHALHREQLRRTIREHPLDRLLARERLAEDLALVRVRDGQAVRLARAAQAIRAEREPAAVER